MAKYKIWYVVWDGGDGSAHPTIYKSQDEMNQALEDAENSEYDEIELSEGGSFIIIDTNDFECMEDVV